MGLGLGSGLGSGLGLGLGLGLGSMCDGRRAVGDEGVHDALLLRYHEEGRAVHLRRGRGRGWGWG